MIHSINSVVKELIEVGVPVSESTVDDRFHLHVNKTDIPIHLRSLENDWVYYFKDTNDLIFFLMEYS